MESRQNPITDPKPQTSQKPQEATGKPKRFRLVRLEERIAPRTGGGGGVYTDGCQTDPCPRSNITTC